jgi:hypothetical protein
MRDRRFGQDAVAEVEDQRTLAEILEDIVDRAIERGTAGEQCQRIEIAFLLPGGVALS